MHFVDLNPNHLDALCEENRKWKLRSSDAGHLYCFGQALIVMPDLQLFTMDEEMTQAAQRSQLPLWPLPPPAIRERRASYRTRKATTPP